MRSAAAFLLSCTLLAGPKVTFVGDSLMVALAPEFTSALRPTDLERACRSGSHLSQWLRDYSTSDLAVVLIGTNDTAGPAFMTPAWKDGYRRQLLRLLVGLHSTKILWVGIPAMRSLKFDARVQLMNAFEREVVSQDPRVTWVSPDPFLIGPGLRTPDGIHFTTKGSTLVVRGLLPYTGISNRS